MNSDDNRRAKICLLVELRVNTLAGALHKLGDGAGENRKISAKAVIALHALLADMRQTRKQGADEMQLAKTYWAICALIVELVDKENARRKLANELTQISVGLNRSEAFELYLAANERKANSRIAFAVAMAGYLITVGLLTYAIFSCYAAHH